MAASLGTNDMLNAWLRQQLGSGVVLGTSQPTNGAYEPILSDSVAASGNQTAPGANVAIVTIAAGSLPAGLYAIDVYAGFGGTVENVANNNMNFRRGGTAITQLLLSHLANVSATKTSYRLRLDGTQSLSVNAIVAASANSVYLAQIVATKVAN